jgi:formate-dependent phosphoribosylglycinamide formyltransferase (GAR transformylase)
MKSQSKIQCDDGRQIKECVRLEILTTMLMKTSVFRNVITCSDLDAAQNRDQHKQEWTPGSIIARITHEPITPSQKVTVSLEVVGRVGL